MVPPLTTQLFESKRKDRETDSYIPLQSLKSLRKFKPTIPSTPTGKENCQEF
jgi:hypothetical protein